MFTIKATNVGGHSVFECASYRLRRAAVMVPNGENGDTRPFEGYHAEPQDFIDLYDTAGNPIQSLTVDGAIYAMNSAGKTIDTFMARPRT